MNYDIYLTCGFGNHHAVNGHVYELIDYFLYFNSLNLNVCILNNLYNVEIFDCALKKYNISEDLKTSLLQNIIQYKYSRILRLNNILFVDGKQQWDKNIFIHGNINGFRCVEPSAFSKFKNVFQDSRIYEDLPNSIHYVKKINFDYYKEIKKSKHRTLLYLTSNCRMVSEQEMLRIRKKYPGMRFLIISDVDKPYFHFDNAEFRYVPVDILFEEFDTYMYTEVKDECHGDCSPRFIAECKFYGKEVIYENLTSSRGLEIRKYDIEHNFEKLFLTKNDPLADYIFR